MLRSLLVYLEMIKIQHSIFALPFAMIGMLWAADGWPGWIKFLWILVAMVSCRSAAMSFNRIVDRNIDALNPRTAMRALPKGLIDLRDVYLFFLISCAVFILSAAMLNPLALILSPVALFITLGYSYAKRFTPFCHFILGLSLGIAPLGAWIGVKGTFNFEIFPLALAVLFWSAGFDILYALLDEQFDKDYGVHSIPQQYGRKKALLISKVSHFTAICCFFLQGLVLHAGMWYFFGVFIAGMLLFYEQILIKPNNYRKIHFAFATLNGVMSINVFIFTLIDIIAQRQSLL